MSMIRARFVRRNGESVFGKVDGDLPAVWQTMEPCPDVPVSLMNMGTPQLYRRRITTWRREFWDPIYGPLACPLDGVSARNLNVPHIDVLYRET